MDFLPAEAKGMGRENRKSTRVPLYRAGSITGAGTLLAHCIIIDISQGGAQLRLTSEPELPARFILNLCSTGSVRRSCQLIWRDGNRVGVKFLLSANHGT